MWFGLEDVVCDLVIVVNVMCIFVIVGGDE